MIFDLTEKILELAENQVLSIPKPRSKIEKLFQVVILKPWKSFIEGLGHISFTYFKFFLFFIVTAFAISRIQNEMVKINVLTGEEEEMLAAFLLLIPILFRMFSSPKDYGLSIESNLITHISHQIGVIVPINQIDILSLIEKNLDEMQKSTTRRVNASKFSVSAFWGIIVFFVSKDSQFPFDIFERSNSSLKFAPGIFFCSTLLLGLSSFILGLGVIQEKVFLSIKLAINEYKGNILVKG